MSVVVFGSLNMDLTAYSPRLPRPGETLFGSGFQLSAGGKGANQAVAAARLGAPTVFVGRVGQDMFGAAALRELGQRGVDTDSVWTDPEHGTGLAVINVDEGGENAITVISGANMALGERDVRRAERALQGARVLLLQLEVPSAASQKVAALASERGVLVVLDPAPAQPLGPGFLQAVDILTPNEGEASELVGYPVEGLDHAARAAGDLLALGVGAVALKMGRHGVYFSDGETAGHQQAFAVEPVDTVAAGDAFNGGLAAALLDEVGLAEAVRWGAAAGALAVTRRGAIPAMPDRSEVEQLLAGRPE